VAVFKSNLLVPTGVATDPAGHIFVSFQPDEFHTAVAECAPNGTLIAEYMLDGAVAPSLTYDADARRLLALAVFGEFYVVDPSRAPYTVEPYMNVGSLSLDKSAIYDIQTGQTNSQLAREITPTNLLSINTFGAIADYKSSQYGTELLLTLQSNGDDFVIRIRNWQFPQTVSAQVLAGSSGIAGGPVGVHEVLPSPISTAPGVTINSQGMALTTLPYTPRGQLFGYDIPISFNIDNPSFAMPLGNSPSAAVSSRGMTVDSHGDFLIATGEQGSIYTGGAPGIVILDPNLANPTALALPYLDAMQGVAVGPNDASLYLVIPSTDLGIDSGKGTGEVVVAAYAPPQSQPSPGGAYLVVGGVYDDRNGNGQQDSGETGLAGWTVFDDTNVNGVLDAGEPTAQTDASGIFFLVVPLPPTGGASIISAAPAAGWNQTFPPPIYKGAGYPIIASSFDPKHILETPLVFGVEQQIATMSGTVYDDQNGDGSRSGGDNGLAGWMVFLDANGNGTLDPGELTATTGEQGNYSFTVPPGSYSVYLAPRTGWAETQPGPSWTWHYSENHVAAGAGPSGLVFGVQLTGATLAGIVYDDQNKNGARDSGEAVLAGWTLFLDTNQNGTLDSGEASTLTDAQGRYSFTVQPGNNYRVVLASQPGWTETEPGSDWTWYYYANQVANGATYTTFDFGVAQGSDATLSGTVYNDQNQNGSEDTGEAVLAGWTVFVDSNGNGVLDPGEPTTQTNAQGQYSFSVQPGNNYDVYPLPRAGWDETKATNQVEWDYHYYANQVASGANITGFDFAVFQVTGATISGTVYDDQNQNGSRDSGEAGLAGWTLFLDSNNSGVLDAGEPTTLTNAQGEYSFGVQPANNYQVLIVPQAGWIETAPGSNWTWHYYTNQVASGANITGFDFGVFQVAGATLSGTVFNDQNVSGSQEPGEAGLAGWTLFLDSNGNGVLDPGETTTQTNSQGQYLFNVQPGNTYHVYVAPQSGWDETKATNHVAWDFYYYANQVANGANFADFDFGVFQLVATTTTVLSSKNPANPGDSLSFTAKVTAKSDTATPSGSVQFDVDGNPSGAPVALVNGSAASAPIANLTTGHHTVTAVFTASSPIFLTSTGALDGEEWIGASGTAVTIAPQSGTPVYGHPWSVTAILASIWGNQNPTGTVQFQVDGSNWGPAVTLVNGQATSPGLAALAAGGHTISASYSGDARDLASSATPVTTTVNKARLTVTADNQSRQVGQVNPVFTATFSGLVLGQDASVLAGSLSFVTAAQPTSPAGSYPIDPGGLTSSNYDIQFVPGTLTVAASPAPVTVASITLATIKVGTGRKAKKQTELLVHYTGAVDAGSAQNLGNYVLTEPGRDKRYGTRDDKSVRITSARYDPATHSAALLPKGGTLLFSPTLQLRIVGSSIRDSTGRAIDVGRDITALLSKRGATITN
jgi:hypothetical protein